MGKLKVKEGKHNHLLTNILKVLIFATIMLAPFFSVLSKCLYVAVNKNAKNSYYGETINETQYTKLENNEYFVLGKNYKFSNVIYSANVPSNYPIMQVSNVYVNGILEDTVTNLYFSRDSATSPVIILRNSSDTNVYRYNLTSTACNFTFTYEGMRNYNVDISAYNYFYSITYNKYSYLDNAFTYAVEELHNQQIFNWTENTAIYQTINTMTTGLGFNNNNNTLALLLTYWALNTAVYIIFDLVIWIFTKLTHILND